MQELKRKACRNCNDKFAPFNSTTVVCSTPCAIAYAHSRADKKAISEKRKTDKLARAELKVRREALKTRSAWIKDCQKVFNQYIRRRDAEQPCISCGRTNEEVENTDGWKPGGAWDCGHFLSVGSHPELRFIGYNAHKQCKSCNAGSSKYARKGYTVSQDYRTNLVARIGLKLVEWLEGPHEPLKPSIDELKNVKMFYKRQLLRMEA